MISARYANPVALLSVILFDYPLDLGEIPKIVKANCAKVRSYILEYVNNRKVGKNKSQVKGVDLLSLFLESPKIFTDEFIVDELMDFFFAGTVTT